MKFLADVNIPQSIIVALIKRGFDVLDSKTHNLQLKDTEIIELAKKEKRIILTRDKDFIVLAQFPKYQVATIVIRLTIQLPKHMKEHLFELLENQNEEILAKSLTIIREESADSYPYDVLKN